MGILLHGLSSYQIDHASVHLVNDVYNFEANGVYTLSLLTCPLTVRCEVPRSAAHN